MVATDLRKVCPRCQARYSAENSFCPRDATPLDDITDRANEDPLLGTTLSGTYQIVRVIGEGGMGKVYEARHARLTRRFAVKVLHAELARNADILARFRREAESAASVAHRNVLEVFDVANTDTGRPYIVGEFLDGKDFHDFLEQVRRLDVPMAVAITQANLQWTASRTRYGHRASRLETREYLRARCRARWLGEPHAGREDPRFWHLQGARSQLRKISHEQA